MLCETFGKLSRRTWRDLRRAKATGVALGEESITDYLLLELARRHRHEIAVHKHTRPEESKSGADWEWWFLGRDLRCFGMRVQAKKLSNLRRAPVYTGVYSAGNPPGSQLRDLISAAAGGQPPCMPIYCFYNYLPYRTVNLESALRRKIDCWDCWTRHDMTPIWADGTRAGVESSLGCAVASAEGVHHLARRGSSDLPFETAAPIMLPWSCLVCCPGPPGTDGGSLPDRVRQVAATNLVHDIGGELPSVPEVAVEPPAYVLQSLGIPMRMVEEMEIPVDLAGVVVIQDLYDEG